MAGLAGRPLRKAITIKRAIKAIEATSRYRDALTLCLLTEVVYGASNVKFGPEIYCADRKVDFDVVGDFSRRVLQMADDLEAVSDHRRARATVLRGDARACGKALSRYQKFNACICSPPYPTEHDYTRNTSPRTGVLGVGDRYRFIEGDKDRDDSLSQQEYLQGRYRRRTG